jgi:glycosyltransferase involved in cell wall biosynthesis
MLETTIKTASILCVGKEWFPNHPGGLNRYVYELVHQLAASGDQVELCASNLPNSCPQPSLALTNLATAQHPLPQRLWTSQQQFQRRSLVTPDAINLHFALYSFPLLKALPQSSPITFTFHGPWAMESAREGQFDLNVRFKQWMEQRVYGRCDRFIVLSQAFGTILHQTYGIPWEQIHIIPGGVNTTQFQANLSRQQARTQLGWPLDRPILFTPRRLVHRMGLDQLLTALVEVKKTVPEVWLAIAGKGSLQAFLEQRIQEQGLQNHARLLGYLADDQLPIAYQAADLTVVPSQSLEGFGLILVESLACGTPALCTPVGGMPEVVAPFCPELVTTGPEAAAIADRITTLLTGQLPLPGRPACRDYAVTHFDWQGISQAVKNVLLA